MQKQNCQLKFVTNVLTVLKIIHIHKCNQAYFNALIKLNSFSKEVGVFQGEWCDYALCSLM